MTDTEIEFVQLADQAEYFMGKDYPMDKKHDLISSNSVSGRLDRLAGEMDMELKSPEDYDTGEDGLREYVSDVVTARDHIIDKHA